MSNEKTQKNNENKKIEIEDLKKIRRIVSSIIFHIDEKFINPVVMEQKLSNNKEFMDEIRLLIGNKDNITSVIVKLSNLIIKIIPIEQRTAEIESSFVHDEENDRVDVEDMKIILRYIERIIKIYDKKVVSSDN
jgi:uncharacterized membrane protein